MKLWTRLMVGSLAVLFGLALIVGTADAASSKKKKTETKKEAKKEVKKEEKRSSSETKFVDGLNLAGRSGLFYGETSDVVGVGKFAAGAHLTYQSFGSGNILAIPFGGSFGVAENLDLSAGANLALVNPGSTSIFSIDLGGKYRITTNKSNLNFSLGGDVNIPTNTGGQVVVTPRGTVTYVLPSGLLLNGDVGIGISTTTWITTNLGVGVPISDKFSVIGEIGANQAGYTASFLTGGIRYKMNNVNLQALIGLPLNGGSALIGGGLTFASM